MRLEFKKYVKRNKNIDFGFTDKKGRYVGANIILGTMIAVEQDDDTSWSNHDYKGVANKPGEYSMVYIHGTRNGERFGPLQRTHYFLTDEDRDKYIEKRIKAMKKRNY